MNQTIDNIFQIIERSANAQPQSPVLTQGDSSTSYADFSAQCRSFANGALAAGLKSGERVAIYLTKQTETVMALFGCSAAGGCFVPINPALKPAQVAYILKDCDVSILVTSTQRHAAIAEAIEDCPSLKLVVCVNGGDAAPGHTRYKIVDWATFVSEPEASPHRRIDQDMAAILYTSGSTGQPKGVVLSHRNLILGAESVSGYLGNTRSDRILAVLPLSFDAGLSQLTTAFYVGASAVLMDYLLPNDVLRALDRYQPTGLAAVPPLWNQLVRLRWKPHCGQSLRYITNTGGAMPVPTTRKLRELLPSTDIFLMYGLTEAFRSTFLPPEDVERIPESIGKAIPNAQILVVDEQGNECPPGQPGELVHRGGLVALGYWNDPQKTAERFRPSPAQDPALPLPELAVWSGDQVVRDEDGFLYFVSRKDEMIKTSGYRVSPTEVEEVAYRTGLVAEAAAFGVDHPMLGQAIVLVVTPAPQAPADCAAQLSAALRQQLPAFMQPRELAVLDVLPQNANGKVDRRQLAARYADHFRDKETP